MGLALLSASAGVPAEEPAPLPPRPAAPRAAKAYAMLEAHCAGCHQRGRLVAPYPATGLIDILALEEIAGDASLVRPGLPDGSPLYTALLRRAMPPAGAAENGVHEGPAPHEVEALRDWIEDLPAGLAPDCARAAPGSARPPRMPRVLQREPAGRARRMRFLTLPRRGGDCPGAAELARHRAALGQLLGRLAGGGAAVPLEPLDAAGTVFRVDLDALGWTAADWGRLAALHPAATSASELERLERGTQPRAAVIRGDWLAHMALRRPAAAGLPSLSDAGRTAAFDPDLPPVAALARLWERPLDLAAAAELGLGPRELTARLAELPPELRSSARRLEQGLVPRREFLAIHAALTATPGAAPPGSAEDAVAHAPLPAALELAIWSDKDVYARGEPVTLFARASADCHLTLISLDQAGTATVLFPNDLEQDNLVLANAELRIPGPGVAYRLRAGPDDREMVVGICTTPQRIADGIRLDYDRQRFTSLGNWRLFLARLMGDASAVEPDEPQGPRRRRGRRATPAAKPEPLRPENHARTAITFAVR